MMNVNICGVEFKNPVIGASGTYGFGKAYSEYIDLNKLGGISTKGLTYIQRDGNMGIRIYETASGIMNSIGLQNPSVAEFIKKDFNFMKKFDTNIIVNIGGSHIDDYVKSVNLINETDIKIIELNISCPNVAEGGMAFGIKCDSAERIVKEIRKNTDKILMVKLSPNAENIKEMAYTCVEAGADALSLVNTFNALAIDINKMKPVFDNVTAGLSGPCIKPIALRMVREVASVVNVPIVGMGGISNYKDAIEFIMAGATAIQVGTANFIEPSVCIEIIEGMEKFLKEKSVKNLEEIRGII